MKLAIIGNCAFQALLDDQAEVQWLCWPRFDSSFIFGSLVGGERGGELSARPATSDATAHQDYLPNTVIARTRWRAPDGELEVLDFAPRYLRDQRPVAPPLLVRRIRPTAGRPEVRVCCRPVYDYGLTQPPARRAGPHLVWPLPGGPLHLTSNAPLDAIAEGRPFPLDGPVDLVLAWGDPFERPLADGCADLFDRTRRYWERWVKHCTVPARFQRAVVRSALTLKLHQYEPTGAITAAATASLPEAPGSERTWDYRYCWLRDTCFTLGALRRLGHFEEMEAFVRYLHEIASDDPEALQPVYGIGGERELTERILDHLPGYQGQGPVRVGNAAFAQRQHDVYGEMIASLSPLFLDVRFADGDSEHPRALLHRLLGGIERHLEDPDAGPWEKRQTPQLHTFSLLLHWTGATAAQRVGLQHGDDALAQRGAELARRARDIIEARCWHPHQGYYADTAGGAEADAALLMMVNLGYFDLETDAQRARTHVHALGKKLAAGEHLLHRYRHHDGIGDTHVSFTACALWHAEALARLGERSRAEAVFSAVLDHANHVGLLSEDIDPVTGLLWGNFPQTYSHVGIINAAFAISPLLGPAF